MKLLFIGGVFPKDKESEYYANNVGSFQAAANAWQWNVIEGLERNLNASVDVLNAVFIPPYPKGYKKLWEKSYSWNHSNDSKDYNIAFLNLFMIKNIFREINLRRALSKWIKTNKDKDVVVIAYSPHVPFLKCLKFARKHNAKTCLILPDLLKYTGTVNRNNKLYTLIKHFEIKRFYRNLKFVNKFVLFTEAMAKDIGINDNYVIIEGIADASLANQNIIEDAKEKIILYSGTLHTKYGIKELVASFEYINSSNYKLVICGDGDSKEYIESMAKTDHRIQFMGQLRREEIIELQRNSTVLVNPRPNVGEYTKYSFPSKTMEYMLAAKPIICHKLDGIPDEYDDYLIYFKSMDPKDIADKIVEISELDLNERIKMGERSRDFIAQCKNSNIQTQKIIKLLET